jgi:hypothetical protein
MTGGIAAATVVRILYKLTRPSKSVDRQFKKEKDFTYSMPLGHRMVRINACNAAVASHYGLIGFTARDDAGPPVGKLLPHLQSCTDA